MTTLLVDGDIVAYRAAAASETPIHWGEDLWTLHSYADEAYEYASSMIDGLLEQSKCSTALVLLSDKSNFRKEIDTEYKANRIGQRKPICLREVRERMQANMKTKMVDGLEADDLIGIFATKSPQKYIIWSPDKDLLQIAGKHLIEGEVVEITQQQADRSFWMQVLTGDTADNYKGIHGVGPKTAERILDADDGLSDWGKVKKAYEKAGLTVDDAITTARLAFILRDDAKDMPWEPPHE